MQITLLRSARLQAAVHETLKGIDTSPRAEISLFEEFDTAVHARTKGLELALQRSRALISALFEIRAKTAVANAACGVSDVLAAQAENDMHIQTLTVLSSAQPFEGLSVTQMRADKMANRPEPTSPYGRSADPKETINVGLLTAEQIEEHRVSLLELKKKRADLKDRLAELNAGSKIELTASTVETLKTEHLL